MRTGSCPNRLKGQVRETSSADTTLPQPSEGCFLVGALEALSPVWGGCPYVCASVYVQVSDRHKVVQMGSGVYHSGLDQVFFIPGLHICDTHGGGYGNPGERRYPLHTPFILVVSSLVSCLEPKSKWSLRLLPE